MSAEDLEERIKALETAYDDTLSELNDLEERTEKLEEALVELGRQLKFKIDLGRDE